MEDIEPVEMTIATCSAHLSQHTSTSTVFGSPNHQNKFNISTWRTTPRSLSCDDNNYMGHTI